MPAGRQQHLRKAPIKEKYVWVPSIVDAGRRAAAHPESIAAVRGIQTEGNREAQADFLADAIRRVRARLLPP